MGRIGVEVRSLSWRFISLVLLLLVAVPLQAKKRFLVDFDGTLVNDHAPEPGWRTYWTLKRIEQLHSSMQPNPSASVTTGSEPLLSPTTIDVSFAEYSRLAKLIGKGEGMLGDLNPVTLDKDPAHPNRPSRIIPGYYRISPDISYSRFRPGVDGTNWMLSDYKDAKSRAKNSQGKQTWQGRAFPLLQVAAPDEFVLFSARGHTLEEFHALLAAFQKDGLLPRKQAFKPRAHFLNDSDAIVFGRTLTDKKVQAVLAEAQQLLFGPFETHEELVTDEYEARKGVKRPMHLLLVAEDDPRFTVAISSALEVLSQDLHYSQKIKFVLFHTGDAAEVASGRWPFRVTVFDRGFGREALPEEIQQWMGLPAGKACKNLLLGLAVN